MGQVDPDQDAALRRLRAAFGFVELLAIIDHKDTQEPAPKEPERGPVDEPEPPADGR